MLKSAIRRWLDWRRERYIERRERKINARTALWDYKKATGHEGGAPGRRLVRAAAHGRHDVRGPRTA
jgi:hypothetical protein